MRKPRALPWGITPVDTISPEREKSDVTIVPASAWGCTRQSSHFAPSGLGSCPKRWTQGVALGYHSTPRLGLSTRKALIERQNAQIAIASTAAYRMSGSCARSRPDARSPSIKNNAPFSQMMRGSVRLAMGVCIHLAWMSRKPSDSRIERMGRDSNPRTPYDVSGFQDRCNKPLCHPSFFRSRDACCTHL